MDVKLMMMMMIIAYDYINYVIICDYTIMSPDVFI